MAKKSLQQIISDEMPDVEITDSTNSGSASADSLFAGGGTMKNVRPGKSISDIQKKYRTSSSNSSFDVTLPLNEDVQRSDAPSNLAELRHKFLGDASSDADSFAEEAHEDDQVKVVKVQSKKKAADPLDDPGPRTIIVSDNQGIIGSQG